MTPNWRIVCFLDALDFRESMIYLQATILIFMHTAMSKVVSLIFHWYFLDRCPNQTNTKPLRSKVRFHLGFSLIPMWSMHCHFLFKGKSIIYGWLSSSQSHRFLFIKRTPNWRGSPPGITESHLQGGYQAEISHEQQSRWKYVLTMPCPLYIKMVFLC